MLTDPLVSRPSLRPSPNQIQAFDTQRILAKLQAIKLLQPPQARWQWRSLAQRWRYLLTGCGCTAHSVPPSAATAKSGPRAAGSPLPGASAPP